MTTQRIEYRDLRHHAGGSGGYGGGGRRWDSIAKPIGGLGLLEEAVIRAAGSPGDRGCQSGQKGAGRLLRR